MIPEIKSAARFCLILLFLSSPLSIYSQCAPSACSTSGSGISLSGSGNHTIPSGSTSIVASGNTWSGNVTFTDATSILCVDGTWTGKLGSANPAAGTINVNGAVANATSWSMTSGGAVNINIKTGATFSITAFNTISGGTLNITNCGTMTLTGNSSTNGGTFTINNYGSLVINGTFTSSNAGFTLDNKAGGSIACYGAGNALSFSAGDFINSGDMCLQNNISFNGGTLTNNSCLSIKDYNSNAGSSFVNNSILTVNGNFSNSGNGQVNNGTINITGDFSNNGGNFTLGDKSLITCVNWTNNNSIVGPASGCGSFRITGTSNNSGTFGANSSRIDIYDTGTPTPVGSPAFPMDFNNGNVGSATATGTCATNSYANCSAACLSLLPVELLSFTGRNECKLNHLSWITASEINNAFFTIEKSADGRSFLPAGTVPGKGNSAVRQYYEFSDEAVSGETTYYRLKQTDHDGRFKTFSPVAVKTGCPGEDVSCIRVYPNPASGDEVHISISGMEKNEMKIEIQNIIGESVYSDDVRPDKEYFHSILRPGERMPKGIYMITGISGGKMCRTKCIVQ